MAQTLAPVLGASLSGESPVAGYSSMGAAADLVSGFVRSLGSSRGSGGPSEGDKKLQRESTFYEYLNQEEKRAANHLAAGEIELGQRIRRNALVQAPKFGVDTSAGEFQNYLQNLTGEDGSRYGLTADEIALNKVKDSDDYQTAYLAAPRDLSEPDREKYAINSVQEREALKHKVSMAGADWDGHGRAAVTEYVNKTILEQQNVLSNLDLTGPVPSEKLMGLQNSFAMFKTQILGDLPVNLSADQRKPVVDLLEAHEAALSGVFQRASTGDKTINVALEQQLLRKIGETGMGSGEIKTMNDAMAMQALLKGDLQGLAMAGFRVDGTLSSLAKLGSLEINSQKDYDTSRQEIIESFSDIKDPEGLFTYIKNISSGVNTPEAKTAILSGERTRNEFVKRAMTTVLAISELGKETGGRWLKASDINGIFNQGFLDNINELQKVDPESAGKIRVAALEAVDNQRAQLGRLLGSMEAQEPNFIWNRETGSFVLNPNPVNGLPGEMQPTLRKAVADLYDGDVNALIKDKGARIRQAAIMPVGGVGPLSTREQMVEGLKKAGDQRGLLQLSQYLSSYFTQAVPANGDQYAQSFKALSDISNKLLPPEEVEVEQPGAFTRSIQTYQEIPDSAVSSVTQREMDRREGGGNYDTLYGHVQNAKNSPFAGVKVSEMTLAQVLDFTNTKGQYAQHVKGQVGRIATPVGRFQFVGTTLREVAKEMGLDLNTTVFNAQTQNAMFQHYASKLVRGKSGAAARAALRGGWEGFNGVDDQTLDTMVAEIQSGKPLFGTAVAGDFSNSSGSGFADSLTGNTSVEVLPSTPTETQTSTDISMRGNADRLAAYMGGGQQTQVGSEQGSPTRDGPSASEAASAQENAQLSDETLSVLRSFGLDEGTPVFTSRKELNKAIREGKVEDGQTVLVNGQPEEV